MVNTVVYERPLVTHFVYGYKQERTIRAAAESALAQTYGPLEVVLSDDCSPDGTFSVMQAVAAEYRGPHRIVLNRNPVNLGVSRHVERIMGLASGEFIIENGGDDVSLPHRAERLVEAWIASGRKAHVVHSGHMDVDEKGPIHPWQSESPPLAGDSPLRMLETKYYLVGATLGWSRAIYDRFGPISDVACFHDYPIGFRALLIGEVRYLDEPLVLYNRGGLSRPNVETPRYRYYYGDRIRTMRWDLGYHRSYLRDMERVPPPDLDRCLNVCDQLIRKAELTLKLAASGFWSQLASLPRAAALSLRHRESLLLRENLKYLYANLMTRDLDQRHGPSAAAVTSSPSTTGRDTMSAAAD